MTGWAEQPQGWPGAGTGTPTSFSPSPNDWRHWWRIHNPLGDTSMNNQLKTLATPFLKPLRNLCKMPAHPMPNVKLLDRQTGQIDLLAGANHE